MHFVRLMVGLLSVLVAMATLSVPAQAQEFAPGVTAVTAGDNAPGPQHPQLSAAEIQSELDKLNAVRDPFGFECWARYDSQSLTMGGFPWVDRNLYVSVWAFYRYCDPDDRDRYSFVEPTHARVQYNMEGRRMSCSVGTRVLRNLQYNWYFYRPYTGQNWNPPGNSVPCDESTVNAETQYYDLDDVPRLLFGPGDRSPRWKVNLEWNKTGPNIHADHNQKFNPFR